MMDNIPSPQLPDSLEWREGSKIYHFHPHTAELLGQCNVSLPLLTHQYKYDKLYRARSGAIILITRLDWEGSGGKLHRGDWSVKVLEGMELYDWLYGLEKEGALTNVGHEVYNATFAEEEL